MKYYQDFIKKDRFIFAIQYLTYIVCSLTVCEIDKSIKYKNRKKYD